MDSIHFLELSSHSFINELEIRSVERGICTIDTPTIAYARNGHISTSGLKSDVTIMFLDPHFRRLDTLTH